MDLLTEMLDMSQKGYFCGQIIFKLALGDEAGADLIRAMGGVSGGLGYSGQDCGALIAGCCLLSYYGGKGEDEELPSSYLNNMIAELVEWFKVETEGYGSIRCSQILEGNPANQLTRCPALVQGVLEKALELADKYGII